MTTSDRSNENDRTPNPYDLPNTCECSARSEDECGCGGYVDRSKVRAWQAGYDAALRDLSTPPVERCQTCIHPEGYDRLSGPCPTCDGAGAIPPASTTATEIDRG